MRRKTLYKRLRIRMMELGCTQEELTKPTGRSPAYIRDRFTNKKPWTMKDVYNLCRFLHIPFAQIVQYFPEDGLGEITISDAG